MEFRIQTNKFLNEIIQRHPKYRILSFKSYGILTSIICLIPFCYIAGQLLEKKILYGIKEPFILLITILLIFSIKINKKTWILILFHIILVVYGYFLTDENFALFIVSVREVGLYPLFGIFFGAYLYRVGGAQPLVFIVAVYFFLTVLFPVVFSEQSFGSTNRLSSFWDREHEPSIIAVIFFFSVFYMRIGSLLKILMLGLSVYIVLLSGSRSGILSLFLIYFVLSLRNFSLFRMSLLITIGVIFWVFFEQLTVSGRSVDHNLIARLSQYHLAWSAMVDSNFLGIGPDKYGVLSSLINVSYCKDGICTTTMDSTFLKYLVNYGMLYGIVISYCLFYALRTYFQKEILPEENFLLSIVLFGVIMGAITGKLGAFPLNIFFYSTIGALFQGRRPNVGSSKNVQSKITLKR